MAYNNGFHLSGGLVKDCELKKTANGKSICEFTVGVDRYDGKDVKSDYFSFTVWESTAEYMAKYGKKGTRCEISGTIQQNSWEKDGKKHYDIVFVPDKFNGVHLYAKKNSSQSDVAGASENFYAIPDEM